MQKNGFTLIELLIVIVIIGILAAISIPVYTGQQKRAERTEAFSNLQNLRLLEEQFFADRAVYTISLGTANKDHPGNVGIIHDGGSPADPNNALPGFRPGTGLNFSYWIEQNKQITNTGTLATAALTPCFVAYAQGNTGTRVAGDKFAIDCNNNRNF